MAQSATARSPKAWSTCYEMYVLQSTIASASSNSSQNWSTRLILSPGSSISANTRLRSQGRDRRPFRTANDDVQRRALALPRTGTDLPLEQGGVHSDLQSETQDAGHARVDHRRGTPFPFPSPSTYSSFFLDLVSCSSLYATQSETRRIFCNHADITRRPALGSMKSSLKTS